MKVLYYVLSLISIILFLSCCDEITGDYRQSKGQFVDTSKNVRKILLEDYTGFKCGNCPSAAEIARDIADLYPGRVILMTVHSGYFAEPTTTHTYDFRTPEATEWDDFFGISDAGNPNGMVNRINYDGSKIITPSKWSAAVNSLLSSEPEMKIKLNVFYSINRKEFTVDADVTYIKEGNPNQQLVVAILEDSIVQYQIDYRKTPQDIENYVHNHVFRTSMNGTWGEQLSATDINASSVIRKSYTYKIPEGKDWRIEKLKIVAFVHDNVSKEILQAEETDKFILIL